MKRSLTLRLLSMVAAGGLLLVAGCDDDSAGGSAAPETTKASAAASPTPTADSSQTNIALPSHTMPSIGIPSITRPTSVETGVKIPPINVKSVAGELTVNAEDYKRSGGYYFHTELDGMKCGMIGSMVGCQYFGKDGVKDLPQCDSPETNAPMALIEGGQAKLECSNQGFFVQDNTKILKSGQTIKFPQAICTALPESVTCSTPDGKSFTFGPKKAAVT